MVSPEKNKSCCLSLSLSPFSFPSSFQCPFPFFLFPSHIPVPFPFLLSPFLLSPFPFSFPSPFSFLLSLSLSFSPPFPFPLQMERAGNLLMAQPTAIYGFPKKNPVASLSFSPFSPPFNVPVPFSFSLVLSLSPFSAKMVCQCVEPSLHDTSGWHCPRGLRHLFSSEKKKTRKTIVEHTSPFFFQRFDDRNVRSRKKGFKLKMG